VWLGASLTVLLICAGLLLTYWFPSDLVRQELETRLSVLLQGTVRIQSLSFNLLTGLHIRQAQILRKGQPPLTVETLQLDYSFWNLLQGTLRINEVAIEGANVALNLPELSQGKTSEEPPVPPPADQPLISALPVTVDVHTLKILDTNVMIIVSPDLQVRLTNLNLTSSGGLSAEKANLRGSLDIRGVHLTLQEHNLQFPLMVGFETSVHIPSQRIDIATFTIQSEPTLRLTLDGTIEHPLSQKDVHITLHDTQIDLAQLIRLGHGFLPPNMQGLFVKGILTQQITIKGSAPDGVFSGTLQGTLSGKDLETTLPSNGVQVGRTDIRLTAKDILVERNTPILAQMEMTTSMHRLLYQHHQINQVGLALSGEFLDAGPFSGTIHLSGDTTLPSEWLGQSVSLPFDINLTGAGNYKLRHLTVSDLQAQFGAYGEVQGKAKLKPRAPPSTTTEAALEVRVLPRFKALLPLVPKALLAGITLKKGASADSIHLRTEGVLNQDYFPEAATLTAAVKLTSLHAHVEKPAVEGTLENLVFLLSGDYQHGTGTVKGTGGLSTNLTHLKMPEQLHLNRTALTLKSNFQGQLTSAFQPTSFQSEDQLKIVLEGLEFTHPSVTAHLPSVKLVSNSKEDLFTQHIVLTGLRLSSPDIFEVALKGRWQQPTQKFELNFLVPFLRLDQLLPRMTGPLLEGLQDIHPSGVLSVSLQTMGSAPSETDIKALNLPLRLNGTISLKDAGGKFAGFGLQKTDGTVSLAYAPTAGPQLQFLTDLHMQNFLLPTNLPLQQLPNTTVQIKAAVPSTNEVRLDQFRVTSNGLNTTIQGAIVGLRSFLDSPDPLGIRLAQLFAELETHANVDLGVFQQVLKPLGIQGTGQAGIRVQVRKKEQGTLASAVDVSMKQVSLRQDTSTIQDTTGSIQLRKSLAWKPGEPGKPQRTRFQPSDVIAQLQRLSKKEDTLTLKHLQIGPLTVQDFSTHLHFDQRALKVQNMSMNLLGGGLGGNVILAAEHPPRLSAWLEAAQLDLNQLVDPAARIAGDSEIAATIGLTALLQDEAGALDLSQSEFQLHITHIGKEALDRLLVFLDPQGSRPALAIARSQLKLANPSDVTLEIARGLLNLTIHFQGRLIPTFHLDRVPLAKMKNIERLTAAIPNWEAVSKILTMIGAESYSFTPEGELVMQ